jgi:hypothetical protein
VIVTAFPSKPSQIDGRIFAINNSRAAFVDQAQDQGIKAVRSGAG